MGGRRRDEREREIREEIGFHLDMRIRDFRVRGLGREEARRAAERRFGDVEKVVGACLRASGEEDGMVQKVTLALLVALVALVGWETWRSRGVSADRIEGLHAEVRAMREALADFPGAVVPDPERAVVLSGRVERPGVVAWREGLTLTLALAERGGPGNFARPAGIRILRRAGETGGVRVIPADLERVLAGEIPDPELRPGDIVEVPDAYF